MSSVGAWLANRPRKLRESVAESSGVVVDVDPDVGVGVFIPRRDHNYEPAGGGGLEDADGTAGLLALTLVSSLKPHRIQKSRASRYLSIGLAAA
jgi:hypothetical protein